MAKRLFWIPYAGVLLLGLTVSAVPLLSASSNSRWYVGSASQFYLPDFVWFHQMGQLAREGRGEELYDPALQLERINALLAPARLERVPYYDNPPTLVLLMLPFSLAPIHVSFVLWSVLSLTGGALALCWLLRRRGAPGGRTALLVLASAASAPAFGCALLGQQSWLLVAVASAYFLLLQRRSDTAAGLVLSLSAVKPQYSLFLLVPALVQRRWRVLSAAAVATALVVALTALAVGWRVLAEYPSTVLHAEATPDYIGIVPQEMISLRALLTAVLPTQLALRASLGIMLLALAAVAWSWGASRGEDAEARKFGITVCAALVFSPHSHAYDALLMAVPAALACSARPAEPTGGRLSRAIILLYALYPVLSWVYLLGLRRTPPLSWGGAFLLTHVLILLLSGWQLWRAASARPATPAGRG